MSEKAFRSYYLKDPSTWKERLHSNHQKCTKPKLNHITGFAQDSPAAPQDSPVCALKKPRRPIFLCYCSHAQCAFPPPQHLTCRVFGTGSGWRTGATARLCYQAPASTAACSGAQLPQNPLTDTPGAPAQPTLGRKAYVLLVLEHQHKPRRGKTTR